MAALFVAIPLLFYFRRLPNLPIPFLLAAFVVVLALLRRDPTFDRRLLWNFGAVRAGIGPVLLRAALLCPLMALGVWMFVPDHLFNFVLRAPLFWAVVMLLYPLLSVYPQEVLYRAWFFHRYRPIVGDGLVALLASALLFGFVHLIFGRWISVLMSAAGGWMFANTYRKSNSLALVCIEHAIYGNFIFTVGLGEFFYHGARR